MKFLGPNLVALNVRVDTPEEAIRKAGQLLLNQNHIYPSYIEAMVRSYRKNGPYFVLAPQIALPHARPEDGAREASVSLVQLAEPIEFGHKTNDPVRLVLALGASNSDEHLEVLKKLMVLLGDKAIIEKMIHAKTYEEIEHFIRGVGA
ncbi:PTS sugar transporter subunit IIA [Geobacillus sp. BMUD]|uniref:PTS sugar transporter subunit IIA n=1 Tax=Geobacillus sp. BMUD TaxID=2508876 RepID=UPI001490DF7F|nr:PTS sugar transporter subunit IIA [Geobacillus sp. BMUD]NNU82783.1 PTS sugar transporter subunit IIA [Geobacillus sp. BMUD]